MQTSKILTLHALMLIFTLSANGYEKNAQGHERKPARLEREYLWPKGKMPHAQEHQIAAMSEVTKEEGFKPDKNRLPYLEWYEAPDPKKSCGTCVITISGGSYNVACDDKHVQRWCRRLTDMGVQCVNLVYRTPRPVGLPIYQSALEDGQRAVRLVRSEAAKRGYSPDRIGTFSMSAGSHLALQLATSSTRGAYEAIDAKDTVGCSLDFAVVFAPAYVTTDAAGGRPAVREGYGPDVRLDSLFIFDAKTCPMSLHHGGKDPYSPNGSTLIYRELHKRKIPAELHLYPGIGHAVLGEERGFEFMRQMGFLGKLEEEVKLLDRYPSDDSRDAYVKEVLWPEGKVPYADAFTPYKKSPSQMSKEELAQPFTEENMMKYGPFIEWHFPKERKSDAIQIIYSGGGYNYNTLNSFEVAPVRRFLNDNGITVVTLQYRNGRPSKESGLAKHTPAWADLQRAVRLVRSKAASYGLNPQKIGIMGSSAGGHLTVMGVTSSVHQAYRRVDEIDKTSCAVQWGIGIYPAYVLQDGADGHNANLGVDAGFVDDFSFDVQTAPMLLIHGDKDGYSSMASVRLWEKMRAMGIQSELHTLAERKHCFNGKASEGTGSYTYMERILEFILKQTKK